MARIAALVVALAALLAAAPAQGAATIHPDQFLESGTITPSTSKDHPFTTTTSLAAGHYYRLVLTGSWELQWPATQFDPAYEQDVDSIFCSAPCATPTGATPWYGVGMRIGTTEDSTRYHCCDGFHAIGYDGGGANATHTYDYTFYVSQDTGPISFWDPYEGSYGDSGYPTGATGSFGFQLYGTKDDSGGGSTTGKWDWSIGPLYLAKPASAFTDTSYVFTVASTVKVIVHETVRAHVGRKSYAAGKRTAHLQPNTVYTLDAKVPAKTRHALVRAANAKKKIRMRATFSVVSAAGTNRAFIDRTFG